MTNKERCLYHAAKALELQKKVVRMEEDALARARTMRVGRAASRLSLATADEYYQARLLAEDFWYKSLCSSRNAQQTMSQVYGIAALVEALP